MAGIATNQNAVLAELYKRPIEHVSLDKLDDCLDIPRGEIIKAASQLVVRGFIVRSERGNYGITPQGFTQHESGEPIKSGKVGQRSGVRSTKPGSLRQRMWNAMRQVSAGVERKAFSLPDILLLALHDGEESQHTYENAGKYITALKKTGYLLTINRRQPGTRPGSNGFDIYRLARDSGEKAPVTRVRKKCMFDPNTLEVFPW